MRNCILCKKKLTNSNFIPIYDCIRYGSYDTFKYLKKKMGIDAIYDHVILKINQYTKAYNVKNIKF